MGDDLEGLGVAARLARKRRMVSNDTCKWLVRVDTAFAVVRHLTEPRVSKYMVLLEKALGDGLRCEGQKGDHQMVAGACSAKELYKQVEGEGQAKELYTKAAGEGQAKVLYKQSVGDDQANELYTEAASEGQAYVFYKQFEGKGKAKAEGQAQALYKQFAGKGKAKGEGQAKELFKQSEGEGKADGVGQAKELHTKAEGDLMEDLGHGKELYKKLVGLGLVKELYTKTAVEGQAKVLHRQFEVEGLFKELYSAAEECLKEGFVAKTDARDRAELDLQERLGADLVRWERHCQRRASRAALPKGNRFGPLSC